ncbi:MAG: putative lipid II flippase FtsW [Pyrinomonadaceae bacterium]|jgi:cell division protein FtsW|nr:putative lipid II flippase FtsW [Pyrinomonadaceae bacterium]
MAKKIRIDWFLFAITATLSLFGVIMVYSASAMLALKYSDSQYTFVNKQLLFTGVGILGMYIASQIHYRWYQKSWVVYGGLIITAFLLLTVFAFPPINGARRWLRFAGMTFQPSEVAKLILPIFLAYFWVKREKYIENLKEGVLPAVCIFGILATIILFQKDLGTVIVLSAIFVSIYFAAGAKILHIGSVVIGLVALGGLMMIISPYRMARFFAFLNPWENADKAGYQVVQGLMSIGSGGITGEGFAKGQQKLFYLPFPHSDFIFAVVGEEFGLIGTLAVVLAFGLLLWRGTRAALMAPDRFGKLLGIGIITGLIVQALFNISVVLSIVPAKGIPLPFISYGGSSIVLTMIAVGILLNLSQYSGFVEFDAPERKVKSKRLSRAKIRTA